MMVKLMSGKKVQPAGESALAELEAVLCEVLDAAAAVTVPLFRRSLAVHDKGDGTEFDPVTPADRWAERAMRELLGRRVPAHRIEGEEHGSTGWHDPHGYRWILDPIDGTKSYVAGIPLWGTVVGLWQGDEPLIGGIDHPILGERFIGGVGGARRIHAGEVSALKVRACARLDDAVLCATEPQSAAALAPHVRFTRYSTDCYAYALLASGLVDAVLDTGLQLHDIAAIVPVVQAAGGTITDWQGGHDFASGRIAAAGDRRVHAQMLSMLSGRQTIPS